MVPKIIYFHNVKKFSQDFVISVDQASTLIQNAKKIHLYLLVALYVEKKDIYLDNVLKTKRVFIEKEAHVLAVDQ